MDPSDCKPEMPMLFLHASRVLLAHLRCSSIRFLDLKLPQGAFPQRVSMTRLKAWHSGWHLGGPCKLGLSSLTRGFFSSTSTIRFLQATAHMSQSEGSRRHTKACAYTSSTPSRNGAHRTRTSLGCSQAEIRGYLVGCRQCRANICMVFALNTLQNSALVALSD